MKLTGTYQLAASREKVFNAISDPSVLQRCIEGCEKLVKIADDHYEAQMKMGLAGIKGTYTGKVRLSERQPNESYTLSLDGKGAPGFVKGTARIRLADKNGKTELHCEADVQVGGMIAAIGSRLIEAAGRKMMDDFFRKFGEAVTAGPQGGGAETKATPT